MRYALQSTTVELRAKLKAEEIASKDEHDEEIQNEFPEFETMISMKNGPYVVINEKNRILIPEKFAKEYNKSIQKEYSTYKKEHYNRKDKNTGETSKPLFTSLDSNFSWIDSQFGYDIEDSDDTIMIREAMLSLRKKNLLYYHIVVMHHFEGQTFIEISKKFGYTRQTISDKFDMAKEELRKILEGSDDNESDTDNNIPANGQKAR